MAKIITIRLTYDELWELMNNFSASFEDGHEGNEVAARVSGKLSAAFLRAKP